MQSANLTAPVTAVCAAEPALVVVVVVEPRFATPFDGDPPQAARDTAATTSTTTRAPAAPHPRTVRFRPPGGCRTDIVRPLSFIVVLPSSSPQSLQASHHMLSTTWRLRARTDEAALPVHSGRTRPTRVTPRPWLQRSSRNTLAQAGVVSRE